MSWGTVWTRYAPSLLLVGLLGRQLGLQAGFQVVETANCSRWGTSSDNGLFEDGDIIIGGLFSLRYTPPSIDYSFMQQPDIKPCKG